jgi:hypothetical protein
VSAIGTTRRVRRRARRRLRPTQLLLSAGALAGAVGAILALSGTVESWFRTPVGRVTAIAIQGVQPLTYGEWRDHENAGRAGIPRAQLRSSGVLITFNADTSGFAEHTLLPVRLIVHDRSSSGSRTIGADPIEIKDGLDCGCADWVPTQRAGHRYWVELEIWSHRSRLRTIATSTFVAS